MNNPFTLGLAQAPLGFCNREQERDDLKRHARNASNVLLFSPRRFGKSSLMMALQDDLRKEGMLTIYADLFPISSEDDFISRFAAAVYKGIGTDIDHRSLGEKLKDIFTSIRPVVELGPNGPSLTARLEQDRRSKAALDDLMEGLHRYVAKEGVRACVVLDEFQEITELPESKRIEGTLRSHIQSHAEISYFFVGSRRRILQDIFNSRSRPFYKSAFQYPLREISEDNFAPFISARFDHTQKRCADDVAREIYRKVRGYPYYVQKLSSIAWDATDDECTIEIVGKASAALIEQEAMDFEGIWQGLSLSQRALLSAIAKEPTAALYGKEFGRRHGLSMGGSQKAIKVLLNRDLVDKTQDGTCQLVDPVMEKWLRR